MFTSVSCQDKPILGLVDYTKFIQASSKQVTEQFPRHQAAWVAFCKHVDTSNLSKSDRLMLLKVGFDGLHEQCNTRELAKLLTLAQYLKESFGSQMFYLLFSKRVSPDSRDIENHVSASQLLIDLKDVDGIADLVKKTLPNLKLLVQLLEEKQASYLAEKYPSRDINDVIARFGEKNDLVKFPLSKDELENIKEKYLAISSTITSLYKLSTADLKEQAHQSSAEWRDKQESASKERLIAIIVELIRRHYNILPYDTQILAFLALINKPNELKGRISQIKTGEGKSTIIAMLAAYEACLGQTVDVVTSSSYLAKRDQDKYSPFFKSLGFDSSHICDRHPKSDKFKATIIYGTNTDFEFSVLRDKLDCDGLRGARKFQTVIVDEVDNLFLDAALNSAIIAIPGTLDISWVYHPILNFATNATTDTTVAELRKHLMSVLEPKNQALFTLMHDEQLERWLVSAGEALSDKHLGTDYLVKEISTGVDIVIVDYLNTGRLNEGSHWQNGLHQFLQAKHNLKITPESLSVASLSHPTYFTQYDHIIGLTGTMGDAVEREEIQRIYKLDSFDVPPHYPSLRKKNPVRFEKSAETQYAAILEKAREMKQQGRPVLILMKSIAESEKLNDYFNKAGFSPQLVNLNQREDEDYLIGQAGEPGKITIATNAAGRGTDIILAPDSKTAGGLCAIFGFYPQNSRVEDQGDGRAGRQGQPGDCYMILNEQDDFIVALRKRATANFVRLAETNPLALLASYSPWQALNADGKLEFLNKQRSSLVESQSKQRYISCKKEELYYEKLNVFFERNLTLHQALKNETLIKSLLQTCESAHRLPAPKIPAELSTLLHEFSPLQETIDALLINQMQGVKVDWTVLINQYKEMVITQFNLIWAEFYDDLHKKNRRCTLEEAKQSIDSSYQTVDETLKLLDTNPQENINNILHILLSSSMQRLLAPDVSSSPFTTFGKPPIATQPEPENEQHLLNNNSYS